MVTQMDIHITSDLFAAWRLAFQTLSSSTYHCKVHLVDITSAFKAQFVASRVRSEISSAQVTQLSFHWKWLHLHYNVDKMCHTWQKFCQTKTEQWSIHGQHLEDIPGRTWKYSHMSFGPSLVTDCVSPITISDDCNNAHFITTMTNNPGFTAEVS